MRKPATTWAASTLPKGQKIISPHATWRRALKVTPSTTQPQQALRRVGTDEKISRRVETCQCGRENGHCKLSEEILQFGEITELSQLHLPLKPALGEFDFHSTSASREA